MPKGLYHVPTHEEVWASVYNMKRKAHFNGSAKAIDRGELDLAPDDILFKKIMEDAVSLYNGGPRIESVEVRNIDDAKTKIKEIFEKENFIKFMFPLSNYNMEHLINQ